MTKKDLLARFDYLIEIAENAERDLSHKWTVAMVREQRAYIQGIYAARHVVVMSK